MAPNFTIIDIEGKNFTLSNMRGKIILLNFMSTTCSSCQTAMPDLVKLFDEMEVDLVMVSISTYPLFDTDEVLSDWRKLWGSEWIYLRDIETPPISISYWIRAIPTYVIIDRNGVIRYRHIGKVPLTILKNEISLLLKT